jgi:hypothetical protein
MKSSKIKILFCLIWAIGVLGLSLSNRSAVVSGRNFESESEISKPDLSAVEEFNSLIQKRFLTEPGLGMVRIQPTPPYSKHLASFYPKDNSERRAVEAFEQDGWKVGLYLFGKRTEHRIKNGVEQEGFLSDYKLKQPVIITNNIRHREELSNSSRILKKVKEAFLRFQESAGSEEKTFEFDSGGWWYLAKPVRAVNASCVACHTDYVVIKKYEDGKYQLRRRKVGDVNGVLVYAFKKIKK